MTDQLSVEMDYSRFISDTVEAEDSFFTGEQFLVLSGIRDGATYGPATIFSVSPTGPVAMSGGKDCYPKPTGFVLSKGDYVELNDRLEVEMTYAFTINDSVETVG